MTKNELIGLLNKIEGNPEIAILDGFNGSGVPRTINFGPLLFSGIPAFSGDDQADYADINSAPGTPIILMGYGCY
jgi:hypothetical protein